MDVLWEGRWTTEGLVPQEQVLLTLWASLQADFRRFVPFYPTHFQCPRKGNRIAAVERKISKISRSGRLDPPEHPSAGTKQQEFTSQPGKVSGEKNLILSGFPACCCLSPRGVAGEQHMG